MIHITIIGNPVEADQALGEIRAAFLVLSQQRGESGPEQITYTVQAVHRTQIRAGKEGR